MNNKRTKGENVYQLVQKRLKFLFNEFDNIYVSFSGGKDSGVLLNLCIQYIREHNLDRKIGVYHMDYEAQYQMTTEYVEQTFRENQDILEIYHVCVPFKVVTCASMFQTYWRPWDESMHAHWVRPMPKNCYKKEDFPTMRKCGTTLSRIHLHRGTIKSMMQYALAAWSASELKRAWTDGELFTVTIA